MPRHLIHIVPKLLVSIALTTNLCFSQNSQWINFHKQNSPLRSNHITALAQQADGTYWIATASDDPNYKIQNGGIYRMKGSDWRMFDTSNSSLPSNTVQCVTCDTSGNVWIGTDKGAARFDGSNWVLFNTSNSLLPSNDIWCITIEKNGTIWFGTSSHGAAKYDGSQWTIKTSVNSGLSTDRIAFIVVDSLGVLWFGSDFGFLMSMKHEAGADVWTRHSCSGFLDTPISGYAIAMGVDRFHKKWIVEAGQSGNQRIAKYTDSTWTLYDSTAIGFGIEARYNSIAIDSSNNLWITGAMGLVMFNGSQWQKWSVANAPVSSNSFSVIFIDRSGNKVFASRSGSSYPGLVFFNETGVKGVVTRVVNYEIVSPPKICMAQNYPNPFNPSTTILYKLEKAGPVRIRILTLLGQEIATLADDLHTPGTYSVRWNAAAFSSGVYFYQLITDIRVLTQKMVLQK